MITPAVIGGFATLDGMLLGQFLYAVSHYHEEDHDRRGRRPR